MKKRMKSVVVMVLGFVLAGAVLAGCGESLQSRQDVQQDIPMGTSQDNIQDPATEKVESETAEKVESETGEEVVQASEMYEDNFAVDSKAAKEFAKKIQDAAARKDLEALADLTVFPVYVGLPDVGVVETREDFLSLGAEAVFTDELLESVKNADIENFQPCMAGFPVSDGGIASINFGVADGVLAINGINYE